MTEMQGKVEQVIAESGRRQGEFGDLLTACANFVTHLTPDCLTPETAEQIGRLVTTLSRLERDWQVRQIKRNFYSKKAVTDGSPTA